MTDLDKKIDSILDRNKRVEADKAWERSFVRRGFIALVTYVAAYLFMRFNDLPSSELQALIPTGAYILSTLSLPPLKKWWLKR
ncbi:MAG: hypothetical protein QF741_02990 [Candidatus Peribacteraceae bacterium]|jgi:hypothetical protein|nr:hypothetical protein [Candidatus Peribacteraceae bacterium]MDP7454476.1 hypothetical protein [Candidatus Peribacteraceae bacterium]MDP7646235.1 hypothetical protein [Candidatus Peribacteraceae bacterium]|tara:strand:- start:93 stop:341 length:249 start_codon:yes stop_codon:yes gene_type:complete